VQKENVMHVRLSRGAFRHQARREMNMMIATMPKTTERSIANGSLQRQRIDDYTTVEQGTSSLVSVPFAFNATRSVGFGTTIAVRLRKQGRPTTNEFLVMRAIEG
jgi:hypothetical protein